VHLVGFIIRIYHDTRSPERQISETKVLKFIKCSITGPVLLGALIADCKSHAT